MQKKQQIKSSAPIPADEEATGVKDQNLYFDGVTLDISGNLSIEDEFLAGSVTVTDEVTTDCDFFVGGNVSGKHGVNLNATTLKGDMLITANNDESVPLFNNVSDPRSQRDAMTYNFYQKNSAQTYNCCSRWWGNYFLEGGKSVEIKPGFADNYESSSARYRNCFDVEGAKIRLKSPGIYQVSYQMTRAGGYHKGSDEPNLFLRLNRNEGLAQGLCCSDTRGHSYWETTGTPLFAVFSITDLSGGPYIDVYTEIEIIPYCSAISVIWFPFAANFTEED
ncbi:hypothetical protein [Chlamydia vaughanii]|uniref:hypothetical protein n=1 Tax=Chlamydia vaughanii TaxID=3112552 RepID=UPI0032B25CD6